MLRTGRVLPSVSVLSLACALLALPAAPARAVTLVKNRTASGVDWVSAGVGGIPSDTADITLAGVTGPVTKAYLYTGRSTSTGRSRSTGTRSPAPPWETPRPTAGGRHQLGLVADVTPYVTGDGTYSLTELVQPSAFGANGASLVVLFDDGNPANNRDLIFYEGDDSTSIEATPVVEDRGPLQQLVLQGDLPGRAQITARSAGGGLSLPLPLAPPVLVRLRARNGLCWGGNYSVPARNGRRRFSSRGDFYYPHAPAR